MQQTLLFDPVKQVNKPMRDKEEANDYRYFPDPDLLPVVIDDAYIDNIRATLPELPEAKRNRFMSDYGLKLYDANVLTQDKPLANYFEATVEAMTKKDPKLAANWVMGDLLAALNKTNTPIEKSSISAKQLAQMLDRIVDSTISGKIAKTVFEAMLTQGLSADEIIEKEGLKQVTDLGAIEKAIDEVLANHPQQLADYRSGQVKMFGFFVGQIMKATQGKANPAQVNEILKRKLE